MRIVNDKLEVSKDASSDFTTGAVDVRHVALASIQAIWTGNIKGVLKVQGSNDISSQENPYVVTNWTDITSATLSPNGSAGNGFIPLVDLSCAFIRCVYTADGVSPGAGNMTVTAMGKGF